MKDGRPSRIYDIRHFRARDWSYEDNDELTAYGRRLAWLLNSQGLSLGAFHHLYVCFTSDLASGSVCMLEPHREWWFRSVEVGVGERGEKAEISTKEGQSATLSALTAIRPDLEEMILAADKQVTAYGIGMQFLLKSYKYRDYSLHYSTNISVHPALSQMSLSIEDNLSGKRYLFPPIWHGIYFDNYGAATGVRVSDLDIVREVDNKLSVRRLDALWPDASLGERLILGPSQAFFSGLVVRPR